VSKMFEERVSGKYIMTHIYRDGEEMTPSEVVELLNTLHQENLSLKFELDVCANNKLYSRRKLEEENEQLRQTTKTQQIRIYCQDKEIQRLNEQLNKIPESIRSVWIE